MTWSNGKHRFLEFELEFSGNADFLRNLIMKGGGYLGGGLFLTLVIAQQSGEGTGGWRYYDPAAV